MRFDASVTISATSLAPDASIIVSGFPDASVPWTTLQSNAFSSYTVKVSVGGVERPYILNLERLFPVQTSFKALSALAPDGGASAAADGLFGSAVSISSDGNVLVVGAPGANRADLFRRGSAGNWQGPFPLTPPMPLDVGDDFGRSVTTNDDGTLIVVGAPGDDGVGNAVANSGAAYVFRRNASTITFVNQLKGHYVRAEDAFGTSVAMTGNGYTLLVGVPGDDGTPDGGPFLGTSNSGAATVFADDGGTFVSVRNLKAPNPGIDDAFGASVAIANDNWQCLGNNRCNGGCFSTPCPSTQELRYVVGAPMEDSSTLTTTTIVGTNEAATNAGAVYVFDGTPYTATFVGYVKRPAPQAGANFGASVAISRRWGAIAVGAPNDASGSMGIEAGTGSTNIYTAAQDATMPAAGSVTIFDTAFNYVRYVKFNAPQPGDKLGTSVALGADQYVLAAGAPGANGGSGAALFSTLATNPRARLVLPPLPDTDDGFGSAVAISGFVQTFVGSPREDSTAGGLNSGAGLSANTSTNSGAVFLHVD